MRGGTRPEEEIFTRRHEAGPGGQNEGKCRVFEEFAVDYDRWFDDHQDTYLAQKRMLGNTVPASARTLEIGVGSGRFAAPLQIAYGIDPSRSLVRMAKARGVEVVLGCGEHLPFRRESFDAILLMTVICFLDDMQGVLQETRAVLVPGGMVIIGFIERDGEIFQRYHLEPEKGRFLRHARFYTGNEVTRALLTAGFSPVRYAARARGFSVVTGERAGNGSVPVP